MVHLKSFLYPDYRELGRLILLVDNTVLFFCVSKLYVYLRLFLNYNFLSVEAEALYKSENFERQQLGSVRVCPDHPDPCLLYVNTLGASLDCK